MISLNKENSKKTDVVNKRKLDNFKYAKSKELKYFKSIQLYLNISEPNTDFCALSDVLQQAVLC
jgi:hypothetical protein